MSERLLLTQSGHREWQWIQQTNGFHDLNFARWKDFAELVALIAVVGGLVAVIIELRQTQSALRAQAYQTRAFQVNELARERNPEHATIIRDFRTGKITIDTASPEELTIVRINLQIMRTGLDNEHYQYQNGFLDPDFYNTSTMPNIKAFAPYWRKLGVREYRQQFTDLTI
jgi:hypothetical protein